tara:strand:- start:255 stop:1334 length:1080 start_codon:yes stop_codon:yes gene_type:complete
MKMVKYFNRAGFDIELVHPGRGDSVTNKNVYQYYNIGEELKISKIEWPVKFDRFKYFKKLFYIVSHFIWSFIVTRKYINKFPNRSNAIFFTRSNWTLFFLARKNYRVVFEIHKLSKTTSFVFKKLKDKKNVGYIALNKYLAADSNLDKEQKKNLGIIANSFDDEDLKYNNNPKIPNSFIFMGRLTRYGHKRNVEFLVNAFGSEELDKYKLVIVGGPTASSMELKKYVEKNNIRNVEIINHLPQNELIEFASKFQTGILINSGNSDNDNLYTSPLKYFEYLAVGLNVVAVDSKSHRILPFSDNISFFQENNFKSFIEALKNSEKLTKPDLQDLEKHSYTNRVILIKNLFARLEGLEPPTL